MSEIAETVRAAPEIYFVPALAGLGAPWWQPAVKGAVFGLTRATTRQQLMLATLEGIALQVNDVLAAMGDDITGGLTRLRVDGGACRNDRLLSIQAELAGVGIDRPRNLESTAFGAALFSALGVGLLSSLEAARGWWHSERSFEPLASHASQNIRQEKLRGWQRALAAAGLFAENSMPHK
jgi:glycerol kinase